MKQTEFGWIPDDWSVLPLSSCTSHFKSGLTITSSEITDDTSDFPVYGGNGLRGYSPEYTHEGEYVLVGRQGALCGNLKFIQGKNYVSEHAVAVRSNRISFTKYLYYALDRLNLNSLSESSAQPGLSVEKISKLPIPVPSIIEQQAIAEALSDADAWIESLETLIEKKRLIKQGAMQELLSPKDGWLQTTFDEAFYFLKTASYPRADLKSDGYIGYIHYGDIHTKWNILLDLYKVDLPTISDDMLKSYSLVKPGDIIMADASEDYVGVGKSVELINVEGKKVIAGLHTFLLRQRSNLFSPKFMGYLIHGSHIKDQLDTLATGLKVYSISKSALRQVQIRYPHAAEQVRIASILYEMDCEIEALEHKLFKARQIKQGMMQQLLTGQIRLVKPATATAVKTSKRATA